MERVFSLPSLVLEGAILRHQFLLLSIIHQSVVYLVSPPKWLCCCAARFFLDPLAIYQPRKISVSQDEAARAEREKILIKKGLVWNDLHAVWMLAADAAAAARF